MFTNLKLIVNLKQRSANSRYVMLSFVVLCFPASDSKTRRSMPSMTMTGTSTGANNVRERGAWQRGSAWSSHGKTSSDNPLCRDRLFKTRKILFGAVLWCSYLALYAPNTGNPTHGPCRTWMSQPIKLSLYERHLRFWQATGPFFLFVFFFYIYLFIFFLFLSFFFTFNFHEISFVKFHEVREIQKK